MPVESAQATPAEPHAAPSREAAARGVVLFAVGASGAVLAAGLGWQLLEPPLAAHGAFVRAPLVATVLVYGLPLVVMAVGVGSSWADPRGPRLLLLVVTLLVALLLGSALGDAALDLVRGRHVVPAVVLARYDCDVLDAEGRVETALDCVELAWTRPDGLGSRDRFVIADAHLPAELERGDCVHAHIWPRSERLVAVHRAAAAACSDPDAVRRGLEPPP